MEQGDGPGPGPDPWRFTGKSLCNMKFMLDRLAKTLALAL